MPTPGDFLLLGAGGKMGQGMAELLLETVAQEAIESGTFNRNVTCIDPLQDCLTVLRHRLEKKGRRFAEKMIVPLRKKFLEGTSNQEVVDAFVSHLLDRFQFERGMEQVKEPLFVFEAAREDQKVKNHLFSTLGQQLPQETLFFTNTSAIPISELEKPIPGRLAGLHFYHPAPVQTIVEVVVPKGGVAELSMTINQLLKGWKKERVDSPDIPGFIGNGFMIPEMAAALSLLPTFSPDQVNHLTRDKLFRPLGIFELVDFVGRDTVKAIGKVMGIDLDGVSHLPPSKKFNPPRKVSEEEAIDQINREKDPQVHLYLNHLRKISSDLIHKGVDKKGLEKVLKEGFHHTFVPWDERLKG